MHDGHVGGPKQYKVFPLGNTFYFYANMFFCFSPLTWLPFPHSINVMFQNKVIVQEDYASLHTVNQRAWM